MTSPGLARYPPTSCLTKKDRRLIKTLVMKQLCDTQEPNDSNSVSNQIPAVSGHLGETHCLASVFATDAYLQNEFQGSGGD